MNNNLIFLKDVNQSIRHLMKFKHHISLLVYGEKKSGKTFLCNDIRRKIKTNYLINSLGLYILLFIYTYGGIRLYLLGVENIYNTPMHIAILVLLYILFSRYEFQTLSMSKIKTIDKLGQEIDTAIEFRNNVFLQYFYSYKYALYFFEKFLKIKIVVFIDDIQNRDKDCSFEEILKLVKYYNEYKKIHIVLIADSSDIGLDKLEEKVYVIKTYRDENNSRF